MSSGAVDHSIFSGIQTALFQSRLQTRVDGRVWFLFFLFFYYFFQESLDQLGISQRSAAGIASPS